MASVNCFAKLFTLTGLFSGVSEKWGWNVSGQHIEALTSIRYTDIVDGDVFDSNVSFQACDMSNIQPELAGFDFN